MYVAYHAPHSPFQAPDSDVAEFRLLYPKQPTRAIVGAMMSVVDSSIKRVTEALAARSFWEDTITVVISDNGGTSVTKQSNMAHSNFPLRGGKGTTFEGGLRTMALVHTYSYGVPLMNINFICLCRVTMTRSMSRGSFQRNTVVVTA